MKLSNTVKAMTIIAVSVVVLTAGPAAKAADSGCSNATLRGAYSDQDTGTIVGVGPFAGVNVDSFDGKGHLTISGVSSLNGNVSPGVETGRSASSATFAAGRLGGGARKLPALSR